MAGPGGRGAPVHGARRRPTAAHRRTVTARDRGLGLVAEGRSNDDIAAALHLSVRTVERHLHNVYAQARRCTDRLLGRPRRPAGTYVAARPASREVRSCTDAAPGPTFLGSVHDPDTDPDTDPDRRRRPQGQARAMWAMGDYPAVATEVIASLGPTLVAYAGITAGERVVDIAAGSGNAAIPAARLGADVVATDLTPDLLETGRQAADDAGCQPAVAGGRRRGDAVRGRRARRRHLVRRHHVRAAPPGRRGRAGPHRPPRRPASAC